MEILKILQESAENLIPEDLDFFETELATGGPYDAVYQEQCKNKIIQIRKWLLGDAPSCCADALENKENTAVRDGQDETSKGKTGTKTGSKGIVIGMSDVAPQGAGYAVPKLSVAQLVQADVKSLRNKTDYKSAFKKYAKESTIIDADFLDKNFATFDSWEMDAIVSVKQLGEEFLEKYFGAIDHDKIARYQLFSENFFMKHFSQLDASVVLEHGKNEWRKKENRSRQLDVFLRLKGVKI